MDAIVLAAGLGTRLDPLTRVRAKAAMPVAGEPLVRRLLRHLATNGVTTAVVNLHHRPETIASVLGEGADLGVAVRYSWEQPQVLGSAGGPHKAFTLLDADTALILNGDTLTDVPLRALADAHRSSGALVTLALTPNDAPLKYGGVRLAADGRVLGFAPRGPSADGSFHFIGVQVAERDAFAAVNEGEPTASVGGVYDALIAGQPGSIRGMVVSAQFWDVGTVADYWRTSWAFEGNAARPSLAREAGASAGVTRSILWDDVMVGRGATVDECIVTDGVHVPPGATYRRTILIRTAAGEIEAFPFTPEPA